MAGNRQQAAGGGASGLLSRLPAGKAVCSRLRAGILARPVTTRWLLAGPGALLAALLFMAATPVWMPGGAAGIDNIVYPVILAPLFWVLAFTYACLEENLPRGAVVIAAVIVLQSVLIAAFLAAVSA